MFIQEICDTDQKLEVRKQDLAYYRVSSFSFERALERMTSSGVDICFLLPHDSRVYADKYADEYLLGRLSEYLERRSLPFISAVSACPDESCVKRIVSALDLVVTSRMHLAIAAMSRSVPAVSFAYQGKFEGLYRFFDFEEPPIFRASSFRPEDLARTMASLLSGTARPMMQRCNESIRRLAGDNFDFLETFPPAASPAGA